MLALTFLAEVAPDTTAKLFGAGFMILLVGIGIAKCIQISRRPQTNTKCALGLGCILSAWFTSMISVTCRDAFPGLFFLAGLFGLLALGFWIGGLILAIIGLFEYQNAEGKYTQGRAQGIWTLVLVGLTVTLGIVGVASKKRGPAYGLNTPSDGKPIVLQEFNCQLTPPGKPWVVLDALKINRAAKIGLAKGAPSTFFMLIPEKVSETDFTPETLAEAVLINLNSVADSAQVLHRAPIKSRYLSGIGMQTDAVLQGREFFYVHHCFVTNGWAYQLITWGDKRDSIEVLHGASELLSRFELLNYYARANPGSPANEDYISPEFHYTFQMKDSLWRNWKKHGSSIANFGAIQGDDAALIISTPFFYDEPPKLEVMHNIFLKTAGLNPQVDKILRTGPVTHEGLEGTETLLVTEDANKSLFYWVRTLRGKGIDYCISAWALESDSRAKLLLADAMQRVKISKTPARLTPTRLTAEERKSQALLMNAIGLHFYEEGQTDQSLPYFRSAFELEKKTDQVYFVNLLQGLLGTRKYQEIVDLTDQYPAALEEKRITGAQRAFALAKLGRTEQAVETYRSSFRKGLRDDAYFTEYATVLSKTAGPEKAIEELEAYSKERSSSELRMLRVSLLRAKRDFDGAITLLKTIRQNEPFNATANYSLGDTLIAANRLSEALEISKELIEKQKDEVNGYYLKGRSQYGLKWYREAKESFEKALRKAPDDSQIQDFLSAASTMLGEGVNSSIKEEIPPVELPAELRKADKPPSANFGREQGGYYRKWISAIAFSRGKERIWTDYITAQPLNGAGVSAFSTFQIGFNPAHEEIFVNRLIVKDPTGGIVSTGNVADYYILDDRRTYATSRKILNIPVSGLQPGYSVDLVTTRRDLGNCKEFPFVSYNFASSFPSLENVLFIRGETAGLLFTNTSDVKMRRAAEGLIWSMREPPLYRWEPLQPAISDYLPEIWVADAGARWESIVTNYLSEIQDRMGLAAPEKEAARKIASIKSMPARIGAVAAYVQTNLTYKAIEFGRRARIPQKVTDIARNKYGDCKDHSLLAQQLLTEVGVPAFLALVNTGQTVRKDLPSADQFDHMIVYVPGEGGGQFLDCTVKNGNLTEVGAPGLNGRDVLVLDKGNPRFVQVPSYGKDSSLITSKRKVSLDDQSQLRVAETLVFKGLHASSLRSVLRFQTLEQRRAYIQEHFSGLQASLDAFSIHNLEQLEQPLRLQLDYTLQNQFHVLAKEIAGSLPAFFERSYIQADKMEERVSPFEIQIPLQFISTVEMISPPEYRWKPLAQNISKVESPFLAFEGKLSTTENGFKLESKTELKPGRYQAGQYPKFYDSANHAIALLTPKVVFERKSVN
jgi:tetratricopeptide (TPR) repeat protein